MDKISQEALESIIAGHQKYIKGMRGGVRAVIKFKDLSGVVIKGRDMSNSDFSGCCFDDADLSGSNFTASSFFACDMKRTNMAHGDFSKCDFRGACIVNANLTETNMERTDMRQGVLMSYAESGMRSGWGKGGHTTLQGSTVRNTDLSGVKAVSCNFSDSNMEGIIIHDAELRGSNFKGANMTGADLMGSNLSGADMTDVVVDNMKLVAVTGDQSQLRELIRIQNERKTLESDGTDMKTLVAAHMKWIDTAGKEGKQLDVSEYDVSGETELRKYPLTVIKAEGSKFTGLFLEGVKMESSVLDRADFRDCKAKGADFRGSSFKDASFTRADFSDSNFGPLKVKRPDGSEILQSVDLSGSKMAFAKLDGTNFSNANLSGVDFSHASLLGCNFKGCNLEGAVFDGADVDENETAFG